MTVVRDIGESNINLFYDNIQYLKWNLCDLYLQDSSCYLIFKKIKPVIEKKLGGKISRYRTTDVNVCNIKIELDMIGQHNFYLRQISDREVVIVHSSEYCYKTSLFKRDYKHFPHFQLNDFECVLNMAFHTKQKILKSAINIAPIISHNGVLYEMPDELIPKIDNLSNMTIDDIYKPILLPKDFMKVGDNFTVSIVAESEYFDLLFEMKSDNNIKNTDYDFYNQISIFL